MLVIAHRGANREAIENSWSAFELAIEGGATRIELDVQLSKDGDACIFHDDDLGRMLGTTALISEMNRHEIEQLKLPNGEPIPFLDQVIQRLLPRVEINVEIKGPREALSERVADLLHKNPNADRVIISSFHAEPLIWLKNHCPQLKRACLLGSDTFSWPFFSVMSPQVFMDQVATKIAHPHVDWVTENFMDQARARGWLVFPWVSMAGEEMEREGLWTALKTFGVDGLCTNYPRQLKSWLEEASLDEREYRPNS